MPDAAVTPPTLDVDADNEPTPRERLSVLVEQRLDIPMAVVEADGRGGSGRLEEALWCSANLVVSGNYLFEPKTLLGRLVALLLSGYAVVVFASLAAAIGAFFIEQRTEQAREEHRG